MDTKKHRTALTEVAVERERQETLKLSGKFAWTCADRYVGQSVDARPITHAEKLAVLAEEFGEVSREVVEHGITVDKYAADPNLKVMPPHRESHFRAQLRKELIQVAAVCVAWAEALDEMEDIDNKILGAKSRDGAQE